MVLIRSFKEKQIGWCSKLSGNRNWLNLRSQRKFLCFRLMMETKLASQTLHFNKKETKEIAHYFYLQTLSLELLFLERFCGFPCEFIVILSRTLSVLQIRRSVHEQLYKYLIRGYVGRPESKDKKAIFFLRFINKIEWKNSSHIL